jgi:hypothetical protein
MKAFGGMNQAKTPPFPYKLKVSLKGRLSTSSLLFYGFLSSYASEFRRLSLALDLQAVALKTPFRPSRAWSC